MTKETRIIKRRRRRDKSRDYVSGPEMHKAIKEWYDADKGEPPLTVVKAIEQICTNLAKRENFKNYTYLDEMKDEGQLACIAALMNKKYDPYKYDNPFAYFTRVAWNGFISIIKLEHKEAYLKHKSLENHMIESSLMGVTIDYEVDDSGRLDTLVNRFEGEKEDE